jgi:hypothetical protein
MHLSKGNVQGKVQSLRPGDAGSGCEQFRHLNFPRLFDQTNKWRVIDSGTANGRLQEGGTVYYGWMVKVTLPERIGPPSHLKGHREPEQGGEGKQHGSPLRQGLLDHCITGSQRKTATAMRVLIPGQTPSRLF